jgi:thioredoxin 1
MAEELTNGEFNDFVKEGLVLIDFSADWCMPCVIMGPIIDELSEKFEGKLKVGKVNVEDNRELAAKFQVNSIPNFILFRDGKKVEQFVGAMSADDFEKKLNVFVK